MKKQETIAEKEKRHADAYARMPQPVSEIEEWEAEQVWDEDEQSEYEQPTSFHETKYTLSNPETLMPQAQRTYEQISRRLEDAIAERKKFPPRGQRTSAYAALQGRINQLTKMRARAHARYVRRSAIKAVSDK